MSVQNLRPLALFVALTLAAASCSPAKKGTTATKNTPSSPASMQLRKRIVDKAQQYVGSSYKYAGTSPNSGFDCSGFTKFVFKEFNVEVSPASAEQSKQGYRIPVDRVKPADLLFFGDASRIQHVAMVVERTKDGIICIHSTTSRGVIVENVSASSYWKPKILFARDVLSR